jgi:RHS repeat-associated protein
LNQPKLQFILLFYDALGRLAAVVDWDGQTTRYTYDLAGNLVNTDLPNGVEASYTYDGLSRLTLLQHVTISETLSQFQYTYDAAGNRLTQETETITNTYSYDAADRLASVDGVPYTWDANGNLLNDGAYTYTYNHANQLVSVSGAGTTVSYAYNGQGDRVSQTVGITTTHYTLDLAAGLTQVLSDGTDTYLYVNGRIAQYGASGAQYFLGDALGSVRQLVDAGGDVLLAQSYEPYGAVLESAGEGTSSYGFTGEWGDSYIELVNLRSRMYDPRTGRFLTKDSWQGNYTRPLSLNGWNYVEANPVNLVDPSGHFPVWCQYAPSKALYEACVLAYYQLEPISYLSLGSNISGEKGCYEGKFNYRAPGYLEGVGGFVGPLLGDYIPSTWGGVETVYDFATMERSSFWYIGPGISDAFLGAGIAQYGGGVAGFRSDRDIIRDYGGPFWVFQAGPSVDIFIGLGAGIGSFRSASDRHVRGMTWYVGGSLSLSDWIEGIDAGGAYLDYTPVSDTYKSYKLANGSVDKVGLLSDIVSGNQSPWPASNQQFVQSRAYFSILALNYVRAYEELSDEK